MTERACCGVYSVVFGFFIGIGGCSPAASANGDATNPDAGPGATGENDAKGTANTEAAAAAFQTLCRNVKRLNELRPKIDTNGLVENYVDYVTDSEGAVVSTSVKTRPASPDVVYLLRVAAVVTCDDESKTVRSTTTLKQDAASSSTPTTNQPAQKSVTEWKINTEGKIVIRSAYVGGSDEWTGFGEFEGDGETSFLFRLFDEEPTILSDEVSELTSSSLRSFDPTIPNGPASCSAPFEKIRMAKTGRVFLSVSRVNTRRFDKRKTGDLYAYKEENQDQFFYLFDGNEKVRCLSQSAVHYRN